MEPLRITIPEINDLELQTLCDVGALLEGMNEIQQFRILTYWRDRIQDPKQPTPGGMNETNNN